MKAAITTVRIVVACFSILCGLLFFIFSAMYLIFGPETVEEPVTLKGVKENNSLVPESILGIIMALLFFAISVLLFRSPRYATWSAGLLIPLSIGYVYVPDTGNVLAVVWTVVLFCFTILLWATNERYLTTPHESVSNPSPSITQYTGRPSSFCLHCGALVTPESRFCAVCGTPAAEKHSEVDRAGKTEDSLLSRIFSSAPTVVGFIGGSIVFSEIAIVTARFTYQVFGPLSLIVTFELWAMYPIWWIWRQLLGLVV